MSSRMKIRDLIEQLEAGTIVPLDHILWSQVVDNFPLIEDIDTHMSGRIPLIRRPEVRTKKMGWGIVEDPDPGRKVVRPLKNEKEARALIADRLAAYERMWDG
jgi:hypothetical protein